MTAPTPSDIDGPDGEADLIERLKRVGEERSRAEPITERGDYMHVYAKMSRADGALLNEAASALAAYQAKVGELEARVIPSETRVVELEHRLLELGQEI